MVRGCRRAQVVALLQAGQGYGVRVVVPQGDLLATCRRSHRDSDAPLEGRKGRSPPLAPQLAHVEAPGDPWVDPHLLATRTAIPQADHTRRRHLRADPLDHSPLPPFLQVL